MLDWLKSGSTPFIVLYLFFFFGAIARGQTIYWLARGVTQGTLDHTHPTQGWRLRAHNWLTDPRLNQGRAMLNKWGLPAISLCYLTVGLQTLVLAAAGITRVKWIAFTIAQIPGSLAWGAIYSTIGMAVWAAMWKTAVVGHPVLAGVILVAAIAGLVAFIKWRHGRAAAKVTV